MAEPLTRPRFTGARLYNDPDHLFSFWYPHTWHLMESTEAPHTVIVAPQAEHIATSFSITVSDLGLVVTVDDLPALREAVEEGLAQLGTYQIESFETFTEPGRLGFELRYTFLVDSAWRKRRALLYYQNQHQYSLIAQGETAEIFDYWQSMFAYIMLTCKAGNFDVRAWAEDHKPVDEPDERA
jgi:hypothetical protein